MREVTTSGKDVAKLDQTSALGTLLNEVNSVLKYRTKAALDKELDTKTSSERGRTSVMRTNPTRRKVQQVGARSVFKQPPNRVSRSKDEPFVRLF